MSRRLLAFVLVPSLALMLAGAACSTPCEDTLTCDVGDDDGDTGGGEGANNGLGSSCQSPDDCDEGSCIDGFCCASSTCDGVCVSCGVEGHEGQCVPMLAGSQDDTCGDGRCDGSGSCAIGTVLSSQVVGSAGDQYVIGHGVTTSGTVAVGAGYNGPFAWGGDHPAPNNNYSTMVGLLSSDFQPTWTRNFSDPNGGASLIAFAANADGASRASGVYGGTISVLGQSVTAPPGGTSYIAAFAPTGSLAWLRNLTTAGAAIIFNLTMSNDGSTYLGGFQATEANYGDGTVSVQGSGDGFIVKYDGSGNLAWKKITGGSGSETVFAMTTTPAAQLVAVGVFDAEIDFGGGELTPQGEQDVFLVKYDADGNHLWSRSVGQSASVRVYDLASDGDGNIVAVGHFDGTISLDGVELASAGGTDVLVMSFDALGNLLWARNYGNFNDQYGRKVALDASGNIYFTGYYTGSIDFGLGPLQTAGGEDGFVTKLAPDGTALWSKALAGPSNDHRLEDVSIAPDGSAVVTGWTLGEATFGGEAIDTAEGLDIFMARLAP